ncbi:MAG: hypothetical protein ABSB75_08345 [Candidatus Limnocylindrales bacterium]
MSEDSALERSLQDALEWELGVATGRYSSWGDSPQAKRAMAWPGRSLRSFVPGRFGAAAAAVALIGVLAVAVVNFGSQYVVQPQCLGCGGAAIRGVVAFDDRHIVGVGGTDDSRGNLVLVRSDDGGKSWSVEHPDAPAFTALALAGGRLYASRECLPTYPPDYALPSGADVAFGGGVDRSFHPAPGSCLYYSDDRGRTWHDAGAGQVVDPSFADAKNGWAHTEYDPLGRTPTTLYSTSDGGLTWRAQTSPCDAATPWIEQAVATGADAGYVLCVGPWDQYGGDPMVVQPWELVQVSPGEAPVVRFGPSSPGVPPATGASCFFMRADGTGWIYTDTTTLPTRSTDPYGWSAALYRTSDGGASWARPQDVSSDWPGARSASFVSPTVGFAAFTETGSKSGIVETTDGGLTWRTLVAWGWWTFEPIPTAS